MPARSPRRGDSPSGAQDASDPRARLRAVLHASGLSQVRLARALGRDDRTVRRWIAGETPIPESVLQLFDELDEAWFAWARRAFA